MEMTTANEATITVRQVVQSQRYSPTEMVISLNIPMSEEMSVEERNRLLVSEANEAKALVFKQLGLEYTFSPDEENAVKLIAESFPGTEATVAPQQANPPAQNKGWGNQSQSWGNQNQNQGWGNQGQSWGNQGQSQGTGGGDFQRDERKPEAAKDVVALFNEGGPQAAAAAGWKALDGRYGPFLTNQDWRGTGKVNLASPKDGVSLEMHAALASLG